MTSKNGKHARHGLSGTRIYKIWANMNTDGPSAVSRWKIFSDFYDDVGDPPSEDHIFARPNVKEKHGPKNFVWLTRDEYAAKEGARRRKMIEGKSYEEWSTETGVPVDTIRRRIRRGWSPVKAVGASLYAQEGPKKT